MGGQTPNHMETSFCDFLGPLGPIQQKHWRAMTTLDLRRLSIYLLYIPTVIHGKNWWRGLNRRLARTPPYRLHPCSPILLLLLITSPSLSPSQHPPPHFTFLLITLVKNSTWSFITVTSRLPTSSLQAGQIMMCS